MSSPIKLQRNGFLLMDMQVSVAILAIIVLVMASAILSLQRYSRYITQTTNRMELTILVRNAAYNTKALKETIAKDARFKNCFEVGPTAVTPECLSGQTYGLTLYGQDGQAISGPAETDTSAAQPLYYDINGARCAAGVPAPSYQCPIAVTTSYLVQGQPDYQCTGCADFIPENTPPAGKRHEIMQIFYTLEVVGDTLDNIAIKPIGGSVLLDLNEVEI